MKKGELAIERGKLAIGKKHLSAKAGNGDSETKTVLLKRKYKSRVFLFLANPDSVAGYGDIGGGLVLPVQRGELAIGKKNTVVC